MEKNLEGKPSDSSVQSTSSSSVGEDSDLRLNGSHGMTLNRPFGGELSEEFIDQQSSCEFHLTVFQKVPLSDRQLSLLLDILNYQAFHFGVNFNMLLGLWYLYLRLTKNQDSLKVLDGKIRMTVTVTETILSVLKEENVSLCPGEFYHIPEHIKKLFSRYLMSKRTYGSRYTNWRPEKYLQVKTVPVEHQFLDRSNNTQPYDSYCKGYGESHPSAHRQKTKFSSELDSSDLLKTEESEAQKTLDRSIDSNHILSNVLFYGIRRLLERFT